ncbi:hypothetical protein [Mesorhizobium sp. WSM3868]|uniref:hypothetical protein n=1 Tax=Mesorhizobium sp. WSM3868 TaxID=2029405 RepID=UPI0032AF4F01
MLVAIPPSLSVARALQYLKSLHKLLSEFGLLRKRYRGPASVGAGLLGCEQRPYYRQGLDRVHPEPDAAGARRRL